MFNKIKRVWHPELFQGSLNKKRYFEGWYFKHVSADLKHVYSLIPGISLSERKGEGHAFIQVIKGTTGATWYFKYPLDQFHMDKNRLSGSIGGFHFGTEGLHGVLDHPEQGAVRFEVDLSYGHLTPYKSALFRPGVMGPYRFVPFMECYHGLVSMDHNVKGSFIENDQKIMFDGGKGYAEKDWGKSMPSSWIWIQSNSFKDHRVSVMFSLARIPWLSGNFPGFLCLFMLDDTIYTYTTWSGAEITHLTAEAGHVTVRIKDSSTELELQVEGEKHGILKAPVLGNMNRKIAESIDSKIHITFTGGGNGKQMFTGERAGFELVGDTNELHFN